MTSMSNIGSNIAQETAGQVPEDVINLLKQQGAERNVSTGAGSNAAYLRSLGLTSLGLKDSGQKNLESILGVTPGFNTSQNPEFQTGANLSYEANIQQQIFQRQQQEQDKAFQQQMMALNAAKQGLNNSGSPRVSWASPSNAWGGGGMDALGFPSYSTATLPGQTPAGGSSYEWGAPALDISGAPVVSGQAYGMNGPVSGGFGSAAGTWDSGGYGDDYYDDYGY